MSASLYSILPHALPCLASATTPRLVRPLLLALFILRLPPNPVLIPQRSPSRSPVAHKEEQEEIGLLLFDRHLLNRGGGGGFSNGIAPVRQISEWGDRERGRKKRERWGGFFWLASRARSTAASIANLTLPSPTTSCQRFVRIFPFRMNSDLCFHCFCLFFRLIFVGYPILRVLKRLLLIFIVATILLS